MEVVGSVSRGAVALVLAFGVLQISTACTAPDNDKNGAETLATFPSARESSTYSPVETTELVQVLDISGGTALVVIPQNGWTELANQGVLEVDTASGCWVLRGDDGKVSLPLWRDEESAREMLGRERVNGMSTIGGGPVRDRTADDAEGHCTNIGLVLPGAGE